MRLLVRIFSRLVLPAIAIFILIVAPLLPNSSDFSSTPLGWGIRLILTLYFCRSYWQFPSLYENGGRLWNLNLATKRNYQSQQMIRFAFIWNCILFSIIMTIATGWALSLFLPNLGFLNYILALSNGLLFSVFMVLGFIRASNPRESNT
jgi:hypothetical protein